MGRKEMLLSLLTENIGNFVSGEAIAEKIGVSRSAVWKLVNGLRKNGYKIIAVTNKGYCLCENTDVISKNGIMSAFSKEKSKTIFSIEVLDEVDSTNTYLKSAAQSQKEGKVVVSKIQTNGRGRQGRCFLSENEGGVYMSLLLKPKNLTAENSYVITTSAAVAVCKALEKLFSVFPKIKWVNDVFLDDKKIAGILTEAQFNMENGKIDYAVLGIGINLFAPENGFDDEIKSIAGSVFKNNEEISNAKNRLIASVLEEFWELYEKKNKDELLSQYKSRSCLIGRKIRVIKRDETKNALAISIDDDCRLIVKYDDETTEALSCGEVSLMF